MLCFRIHPEAICFCGESDFVSLLNTPHGLFLISRVWAEGRRGSEIQIPVFLPFLVFWLREVRGEEVLAANVWFAECVGIVCLFLCLATALLLPHFTTVCPIWAGQKKTQQTFCWTVWPCCAHLNIPKQSLSIFPMQNPGRSLLTPLLSNMPIFGWV